jgi:hypothetical protein
LGWRKRRGNLTIAFEEYSADRDLGEWLEEKRRAEKSDVVWWVDELISGC